MIMMTIEKNLKATVRDLECSDGRISALDGRAERLRKGLQDSNQPLKQKGNELKDIDFLDTEDFLGTGAKFKGGDQNACCASKGVAA